MQKMPVMNPIADICQSAAALQGKHGKLKNVIHQWELLYNSSVVGRRNGGRVLVGVESSWTARKPNKHL